MAKYDSVRKTYRDSLLIEQHEKHPELSYKELGLPFGITKQRVHQILKKHYNKLKSEIELSDNKRRE